MILTTARRRFPGRYGSLTVLAVLISLVMPACRPARPPAVVEQLPPALSADAGGLETPVEEDDPPPEAPPSVYVHVSGAVNQPGVYILPVGQRACDALVAAGGPTPDAFLEAVNLAAVVHDAEKLHIPTRAEWERAAAGDPGSSSMLPGSPASSVPMGPAPLDLNTAGSAALQSLPGIGPVLAGRILAYRAANGPFRSVDDLLKVSGIGPSRLADIRDHLRVGREP